MQHLIRRIRFISTTLILAVTAFGSAHGQTAAPTVAPTLIAVDGRQVAMSSAGSGRYTVIFESGFGTDLRAWRKVAPEVAQFARVVSYSRSGYGASTASSAPKTLLQSSVELDELIAAAGLRPPFIVVGHSYGGLLARAFAIRHPQAVAGLVLVDPADERFAPALRLLDSARVDADDARFDSIVPAKFKPELALVKPVLDSGVFPIAGAVPDVPVVVLTSMQVIEHPQFFLETAPARAVMRNLHEQFARQFSNGTQVSTVHSGHNIALDEPALVVQAIGQVVGEAERRAALLTRQEASSTSASR